MHKHTHMHTHTRTCTHNYAFLLVVIHSPGLLMGTVMQYQKLANWGTQAYES